MTRRPPSCIIPIMGTQCPRRCKVDSDPLAPFRIERAESVLAGIDRSPMRKLDCVARAVAEGRVPPRFVREPIVPSLQQEARELVPFMREHHGD